jgi:hypothetical protein
MINLLTIRVVGFFGVKAIQYFMKWVCMYGNVFEYSDNGIDNQ